MVNRTVHNRLPCLTIDVCCLLLDAHVYGYTLHDTVSGKAPYMPCSHLTVRPNVCRNWTSPRTGSRINRYGRTSGAEGTYHLSHPDGRPFYVYVYGITYSTKVAYSTGFRIPPPEPVAIPPPSPEPPSSPLNFGGLDFLIGYVCWCRCRWMHVGAVVRTWSEAAQSTQ